ncbi:acyl-protein synthetase [Actinoplanes sp. L3-i22]|uniref:LuxE/PaaK family acyltransferase n=1 Tax=Actinoplanes sp. L3-i22 TaxID=2836373 RepID=UPI002104A349|nr:acyl-protein synthetase [Actinoplanes sp. L3-i22]
MSLDELLARRQYSLDHLEKGRLLAAELTLLTEQHRRTCAGYARILDTFPPATDVRSLADVPYLPVALFKTHRLASVPDDEVFKTMTSSGTTGQTVSRVVLDRRTADLQTRALAAIMTTLLGPRRLPMIIIDAKHEVSRQKQFSARVAAVLGMASFGRHHFHALDDDMNLDRRGLAAFLGRFAGEPILVSGSTFMVWQHLVHQIGPMEADLSNATLVHGGGWKALQAQAVDNATFKRTLFELTGVTRVHNFYGMVEQVGSVFLEGHDGYLYPPNFADVIIRDPRTWDEAPVGQAGVIEVVSALPRSYPGHALLTEDLGVVHGAGDPATGWGGKQLEVIGRVPQAELRGCGDTYAHEHSGTAMPA